MKKIISFLLTVLLLCAFFAGCTKSENSNLSDDQTAADVLAADPAVVKELEDLLMSETWHEEGNKNYAYVFNEDHSLNWATRSYFLGGLMQQPLSDDTGVLFSRYRSSREDGGTVT